MNDRNVFAVAICCFLAGIVFAGGLAAMAGIRAHLQPYMLRTSAYELANGQPDWICKYWTGAHGRGYRRQECQPIPDPTIVIPAKAGIQEEK